ncbi:MAG TPA: AAA family ATPase, partial [Thermomicrobiales bacterium]|nr:AAA family ATPase [Thermomicrobiales bacterium]
MSIHHLQTNVTPAGQVLGSAALHLDLLGEFAVWLDGRLVPDTAFPRRKAISLLKLLALQPGYQLHREQVLDLLWPDLEPGSAGSQLYKAIHHARQAFTTVAPSVAAETVLSLQGERLSLAAPGGVSTDVSAFEDEARSAIAERDADLLQRVAARYSGDLLPGDLYEEWTIQRRQSLRDTAIDVLIELGEIYHSIGALGDSADALRRVIAMDPSREAAHRLLMLVYARQGNRALALRQFRICSEAVDLELGAPPSRETLELYHDILDERIQRVVAQRHAPAGELAVLPPLAGRQPELRLISDLLDQLAQGHGTVLAIEGDAGIGKTRLVQELLRHARRRHAHVFLGNAYEHEDQIPYQPFVEALRHALWSSPNDAELIPAELARAIPELPATAETVGIADQVASQGALFAGVLRFLAARATSAPVVVILEDLHAADDGSLKLFHYLARETAQLPLLLIGSWRSNEPGAPQALPRVVGELDRGKRLQRISLTPLSVDEHRLLLDRALDAGRVEPILADDVYRRSEGNPLFASELLHQLIRDGRLVQRGDVWRMRDAPGEPDSASTLTIPHSLRALAQRRLELLSSGSRRLVQLAAVIGRDVQYPLLESGLHRDPIGDGSFLDAIDEVLSAGLLVESGVELRFPHPLLREAIYEQLPRPRRTMWHDTVAGALEDLHADQPEQLPVDAIAHHYRLAGNVDRAVQYLIRAVDQAERVYDHDGALRRLTDAQSLLAEPRSPDREATLSNVLERTGDVERAIGYVDRSLAAYQDALSALDSAGMQADRAHRFALHRKIGLAAILNVNMPVAAEHLALARDLVGDAPLERARLLIAESLSDWHALQFEAAITSAARALALAEQADARIEVSQACEMLAIAHMPIGDWEASLQYELRRQSDDWSPEIVVAFDAHLCLYQYKLHTEAAL